jgi:lysozyme family protein
VNRIPVTFEEAYARLEKAEAGFTNDPKDPGNWTGGRVNVGILKGTKYGIAANTYPDLDIENLTPEQAKAIYKRDWWDKAGGDEFDPAIVFQLWQFAINAGMDTAKRVLQRAAGVADDGHVGEVTIAKVNATDLNDLLFLYFSFEIRYYTSLSKWADFGKGWMNRVAQMLTYCAKDNIDIPKELQWAYSHPSSRTSSAQSQLPPPISESAQAPSVKANPQPMPQTLPAMPKTFWSVIGSLLKPTAKT